jgi:hypothetical protein
MNRRFCDGRRTRQDEVNGYLDLGMFTEAIRAARELLPQKRLSADEFDACLNAALCEVHHLGGWRESVERAYGGMRQGARRRCEHLMLWFYAAQQDHVNAVSFIPGKFSGPFALVNLLFAMSTYLGLKRLDKAHRLVPRCERAARTASDPEMRRMLEEVLGEFYREVEMLRSQRLGQVKIA